jgi:hypothetical protein
MPLWPITPWKSWNSFAGNALPIHLPAWILCLAIYIYLDHWSTMKVTLPMWRGSGSWVAPTGADTEPWLSFCRNWACTTASVV